MRSLAPQRHMLARLNTRAHIAKLFGVDFPLRHQRFQVLYFQACGTTPATAAATTTTTIAYRSSCC